MITGAGHTMGWIHSDTGDVVLKKIDIDVKRCCSISGLGEGFYNSLLLVESAIIRKNLSRHYDANQAFIHIK